MSLHHEHCSKPYCHLSKEEMANPYLVIDELFDFAHLPDVQELLWEWLKVTVTGNFHKTLSSSERASIITLYEKLEKLVEAAHVMHKADQHPTVKRVMARKGAKVQRN